MKKKISVLLTLILILALTSCGSSPAITPLGPENTPEWLNEFPPENVYWGLGMAKQSSPTLSMQTAEARARVNIAQQINEDVQTMFTDYNMDAGNVGNQANSSLVENVSRQVTNVNLSGARPIKRWEAPDGTWWYLVEYKKSDAKNEVASILRNEEAAFAQFKAQQALDMLDKQLANSRPLQVDN